MILIAFFVLACVQVAVFEEYAVPENVNVDEVLKNDRLLRNYINCALDKVKCTPEGEKLKKTIPEALENECAKCNDNIRQNVRKVVRFLIEKKPDLWKEIEAKYDPKGQYKNRYKELLAKEGLSY